MSDYIVKGEVQSLANNSNGVLLGAGIMKKMNIDLNDRIRITSASGNTFSLKVVGVYQSGLAEIDDVQGYANLKTAQRILGKDDNYITDINIKLHDMALAGIMAKEIRNQFDLSAIDIKTANAQFETGTSIRNIITYAVSVTLLIVAGFGIYNQ